MSNAGCEPSLRRDEVPSSLSAQVTLDAWSGLLDYLPVGVYLCAPDGSLLRYNRRAAELWGRAPIVGDPLIRYSGAYKVLLRDGETPLVAAGLPMRESLLARQAVRGRELVYERPDGSHATVVEDVEPLFNPAGAVSGAIACMTDVTAERRREARLKEIGDELGHRIKNTLATVQALATQTFRRTDVPQEVRERFEARIYALSRAHDHLAAALWKSADLRLLIADIFALHGDVERVRLAGDTVRLKPQTALTLTMTLNELCANAAQYGALSAPHGYVDLTWSESETRDGRRLSLSWRESGGPPVRAPQAYGFGLRFVERSVTRQLAGRIRLEFAAAGFACDLDMALPALEDGE